MKILNRETAENNMRLMLAECDKQLAKTPGFDIHQDAYDAYETIANTVVGYQHDPKKLWEWIEFQGMSWRRWRSEEVNQIYTRAMFTIGSGIYYHHDWKSKLKNLLGVGYGSKNN